MLHRDGFSDCVSEEIDILRFERAEDAPTVRAPVFEQWLAPQPIDLNAAVPHPVWGFACRLAVAG